MIGPAIGFAGLAARTLFSGKRAWAAAFLAALPPVVALLVVAAGGRKVDGTLLFQGVAFYFSIWFMVFLMTLIFGIAITSGEIEEGTVGYIYLGALPKWAVTLIQIGVASAALAALAGGSVFLTAAAAALAARHPLEAFWRSAAGGTLIAAIGIVVSLSFYVTCGLLFKRPLAVALVATFFWEVVFTYLPIKFATFTVTNNLRALMLPLIFDGGPSRWFNYTRQQGYVTYGQAAMFLSVLAGLFLVTAMVASMNRSIEGKETR